MVLGWSRNPKLENYGNTSDMKRLWYQFCLILGTFALSACLFVMYIVSLHDITFSVVIFGAPRMSAQRPPFSSPTVLIFPPGATCSLNVSKCVAIRPSALQRAVPPTGARD